MGKKSKKQDTKQLHESGVVFLLYKHPLLVLGGTWTLLLLAAAIAAIGLINVGPLKSPPKPMPQTVLQYPNPVPPESNVPEKPNQQEIPLWIYAAITLGCASASLLIALSVRNSQPSLPRKRVKRIKKIVKARPLPLAPSPQKIGGMREKKLLPQQGENFSSKTQQRPPQKRRQVVAQSKQQSARPQQPSFTIQPTVTVLPAQESHHLDRSQEGLAELMDLRKRQSLRSLMRED